MMAHAHDHDHDHDHSHGGHPHAHGGHDHAHNHSLGHAGHSHAPTTFGFAFAVGITLNSAFVLAEVVFGYLANSLALVSDALHNFADVIALLLAWGATVLSRKLPTELHTYGYRRASILAALANAGLLLLGVGAIVVEAIDRLRAPAPVVGSTVIWVAALGILINGATALLFMRGSAHDLNIRGAYLHMAADAVVSFGVVIAALVITLTGWLWIDPVTSLIVAALVLVSGWGLARDSVNLALDAVPAHIDFADVRDYLAGLDGVSDVHDLHIWAMSTSETAMTVHLVRPGGFDDAFLHGLCEELSHRFRIAHPTIQIEASHETCRLAPADVV
jgi:cobalt-zinc-cadmium efflux system protein